jgi:hypothetical protein
MTKNLRFSFGRRNNKQIIMDRDDAARFWERTSERITGEESVDYAIVSRVLNSSSGQSLICAAGITDHGTQAAGEFITDSRSLQSLVERAPGNWEHMNMQVVLKTKVVGETPSPAEIIAVYFW